MSQPDRPHTDLPTSLRELPGTAVLLIQLAIATLVAIVAWIQDKSANPDQTNIIEVLLLGGVTFVSLQLVSAKRFLHQVRSVQKDIDESSTRIEVVVEQLHAAQADFANVRQVISQSLEHLTHHTDTFTRDYFQHLDRLAGLLQPLPRIAESQMRAPDAIKIQSAFQVGLSAYTSAWTKLANDSSIQRDRLVAHGWSESFKRLHVRRSETAKTGSVLLSSDGYAELFKAACDAIYNEIPDNSRVHLQLFSTMLPSEFFNWPQLMPAPGQRNFIPVAHTWRGSHDYFISMRKLRERVTISRCLLLRAEEPLRSGTPQPHDARRMLQHLHSRADLDAERQLHIHSWPFDFGTAQRLQMNAIFARASGLDLDALQAGALNVDGMEVFPIAPEQAFDHALLLPHGPLIKYFCEHLHSDADFARYAYLTPDLGEQVPEVLFRPTSQQHIQEYATPEIALIGHYPAEATSGGHARMFAETQWCLAIHALLHPYTAIVRTAILGGGGTQRRDLHNSCELLIRALRPVVSASERLDGEIR